MSIAEELRKGDPEAPGLLYDEHAGRLYAYCRTLVGEDAGEALRDTFVAAMRHRRPPGGDDTLPVWLYALARTQCLRREAMARCTPAVPTAGPLDRALARLRPEHREVLALSTLEIEDLARVLDLAGDTAGQLLSMARRRLEQAVIAVLSGSPTGDEELFAALGAGSLHRLVARPAEPPPELRERVLAGHPQAGAALSAALPVRSGGSLAPAAEASTDPVHQVTAGPSTAPSRPPPAGKEQPPDSRRARAWTALAARSRQARGLIVRSRNGVLETVGITACAAAALTAFILWPAPRDRTSSTMDGISVLVHRDGAGPTRSGTTPQGTSAPQRSPVGPSVPERPVAPTPGRSGPPASPRTASGSAQATVQTPRPRQTTPAPTPTPTPNTPLPTPPSPSLTPLPTPSR